MQTNSGFGYLGYGARVYQEPENDPASENGPVRRASGALVRITDPPRMVYRSPHAVVPDAASGAVYNNPPVWQDKFLPDGRLVSMHGAKLTEEAERVALSLAVFATLGFTVFGAIIGAGTGTRNENLWKRAGVAGLLGAGAGFLVTGVAGRTAKLAAILHKP